MPILLEDRDWAWLIRAIREMRCTPFLGAGVSYGLLPLGGEIAEEWARDNQYPMPDSYDLIKVSQYLAVNRYDMFPKEEIIQRFGAGQTQPNFGDPYQPHRVLADLPFAIYITTNYDDFMERALRSRFRDPKMEVCRWNSILSGQPTLLDADYRPHPATPVVFHLHGHLADPYSLVLTEDDYFSFLVNAACDTAIIPAPIEHALKQTSMLFIGYKLADWNFRVLQQSLTRFMEKGLKRPHVAVMLPPPSLPGQEKRAMDYWTAYYKKLDVTVCWATASDFLSELRRRWEAAQ